MSASYVRSYYRVPAKRGMRVTVDGKAGRIVSFPYSDLGVRFDGERHTTRCHPTWRVTYHTDSPKETPMTTIRTKSPDIVEEYYTAAIEKLDKVYGGDADELISMIETTRDEKLVHDSMVTGGDVQGPTIECAEGCVGCLTERIADAVTQAVNGTAA